MPGSTARLAGRFPPCDPSRSSDRPHSGRTPSTRLLTDGRDRDTDRPGTNGDVMIAVDSHKASNAAAVLDPGRSRQRPEMDDLHEAARPVAQLSNVPSRRECM